MSSPMDQEEFLMKLEALISEYEGATYKTVNVIFQFFPYSGTDRALDPLFMEWDGERMALKPEGTNLIFIPPFS